MVANAHIYNPKDNSLAERIRTYRAVHRDYLNVEASLKFLDDDEWADTLGNRKEVNEAHKISVRSLWMATDAIRKEELAQAQIQGLLSKDETRDIIENKHQYRIQSIRKVRQFKEDSKNSHKL